MANASGPPHFPPKFQQIKILTNEDCISADKGGEEISAVYYGEATGAVPFMWESQPGTPKHKSSHTPLPPPLTPPPSHQFITTRKNSSHKKNLKNSNFPNSILSRILAKKVNASPSLSLSSSSSSSSSCSHFVCSTTSPSSTPGNENSLPNTGHDSPSPTKCFGNINGCLRRISTGYCYTTKRVKKVVLSIDAPITLS